MIISYHKLSALTSNSLLLSGRQILDFRWVYNIALSGTNQGEALYIIRNLLRCFSSEIFGVAECEIIHLVNCEISHFVRCEMKFASSHLRSKYFTAELFHMAKPYFTRRRRISLKKAKSNFDLAFFCEEAHKRCVSGGKNAKKCVISRCGLLEKLELVCTMCYLTLCPYA